MRFPDARRGFTLLELMLSLALMAIVLTAIAASVHLYMRTLESGVAEIERAQLARALLRRMADDIRGAVQAQPPGDFSQLLALGGGAAQSALSGMMGDAGALPEELGGMLDGVDPAALGPSNLDGGDELLGSALPPVMAPGIYGTLFEIQVDVSRIPRPDEQQAAMFGGLGMGPVPLSDVRTVTYYLAGADPLSAGAVDTGLGDAGGGLMRREVDRAVGAFGYDTGGLLGAEGESELLAPEVVGLEFEYFDGFSWLPEWDSELQKGLPKAVRISIALAASNAADEGLLDALWGASPGGAADGASWYRLVVRLPAASTPPPAPLSEEEMMMEDMAL